MASRFAVAWEGIGAAIAGYETALAYAQQRKQFGMSISNYQLVQEKLSNMLAGITSSLFMTVRLSQLMDQGKASMSMVKMNNVRRARGILADARDILGGNGIVLDYHIARHLCDIEAIYTYEGTDTVQSLLVGADLTGHEAFVQIPSHR
jgi:glutaryl-CoA dehydrogenase